MVLSLQRYKRYKNDRITQILKQRIKKEKERSSSIALEIIDHVPEHLIIEILSRLSVKDLLQFKSVCKSWYAIISSPNFVSKHLKNYYYNSNINDDWRGCLFVQHYISHAEIKLYELLLDETPRVLAYQSLDAMPFHHSIHVCGPCDGLYYVYQYDSSYRALWNPAINEFKTLPDIICKPDCPAHFTNATYEVYGFGFDHSSRDYKVVVMQSYASDNNSDLEHPVSVLVYTLRTDSWKYCGDLAKAYYLENNKCYIYVNGCCYWFGSFEFTFGIIISFNMANDSFKEMDVPDYAQPSYQCLAVYDDSLAFLSLHQTNNNFDIWTWSEGCWTKKFTVGALPSVWAPIGHWMGNRLLLQLHKGGKLVLFDPDTQEINDLGFQNSLMCQGVFAYMESLVSIKDKSKAGQGSSLRKIES